MLLLLIRLGKLYRTYPSLGNWRPGIACSISDYHVHHPLEVDSLVFTTSRRHAVMTQKDGPVALNNPRRVLIRLPAKSNLAQGATNLYKNLVAGFIMSLFEC